MSSVLAFGERRNHERKNCILPVDLDNFQTFFRGSMRNIGLGGAFIETESPHHQRIGQKVAISIPYQLKSKKITIIGRIIRIRPQAMGIAFSSSSGTIGSWFNG